LEIAQLDIVVMVSTGVTLSGPDKEKRAALELLRVACIPQNASLLQLARVVVKWLRDHPDQLQKPKAILVQQALQDAFPCAPPPTQKEETKPAVKP
jgi:hypothetical protein